MPLTPSRQLRRRTLTSRAEHKIGCRYVHVDTSTAYLVMTDRMLCHRGRRVEASAAWRILMSDVYCSTPAKLNRDEVFKSGGIVRNLTGNEHPRQLLAECLRGSYHSSGRPHVFVHDDLIFASIDGTERIDCPVAVEHLREAVNTVRARQNRPPVLEPVW